MAFVGFLRIALKCFNVLAWPLFSLVYPLCASIRAIESNSNTDIYNLVTYWVSFSLISLFDHAFGQLLLWIPFWPYMKLLAIFWLVMPRFSGSLYVYEHFVHPCVSVTPELVMNWSSAWKEFFLSKENFLAAVERYVEENGAEALEKLIANKSKCAKPKFDVKEVKAVDVFEKKVEWPESKEPNVARKEIKTVEVTEKKEAATANWPEGMEPNVARKEIKTVEVTENKEAAAANWVNKPEVNLSYTENKIYAAADIKGTTSAVAVKENKLADMPALKTVQNEWTCALCQVTTSSETILNSHLQGRRHKAKYEALKETTEDKIYAAADIKGTTSAVAVKENKLAEMPTLKTVQNEWTCALCEVTTSSETILNSHLQGKRHKAKYQALKETTEDKIYAAADIKGTTSAVAVKENKLAEMPALKTVQNEWTCALCQVTTSSETILNSHLQGMRHKAKYEALKETTEDKISAAADIKGTTSTVAVKDNKLAEMPALKTVQNEWTCALCQVTTSSETILNSHLQGRRHKAKYEALKETTEEAKNKRSSGSKTENSDQP